jgi:hypothetical protein
VRTTEIGGSEAPLGERGGAELVVELPGAVRLERARDRLERDLAHAALGGGAQRAGDREAPVVGARTPEPAHQRGAPAASGGAAECLLGFELDPGAHAVNGRSGAALNRYGRPASGSGASSPREVRVARMAGIGDP